MIEPRFTRGEYWLLETVADSRFPVCALTRSDLELYLNKKGHGLTRATLVETFYRLLSLGLIYAENESIGFISTEEQIELVLDEPRGVGFYNPKLHTYYGLTQVGGAQWEAFAAPDWQKFIDGGHLFSDEYVDGIWELICADKEWLKRYIESLFYGGPKEVNLESVQWDYIAPWQATYWKQLDGGHRVRFHERENTEAVFSSPPCLGFFYRGWYRWQ